MTPTIPRDDVAGRAYNDVRNLAKRNGRDPAEYFTSYALEGFLTRLVKSDYGNKLVLKGGVLMATFSERRPTRDIDLAAFGFPNNREECEKRIREIAAIEYSDGLIFDLESIAGEAIRDQADYQGIRVSLTARLATANIPFHVDMNFGDPIDPQPTATALPLLLGGTIEILAYPLTMLLAEKIVTIIDRGTANTRWRDFLDVITISEKCAVDGDELITSIETVSSYREVQLKTLATVLDGMNRIVQPRWSQWRKKQGLEATSPETFADLTTKLIAFADPIIAGATRGTTWNPQQRCWDPSPALQWPCGKTTT